MIQKTCERSGAAETTVAAETGDDLFASVSGFQVSRNPGFFLGM